VEKSTLPVRTADAMARILNSNGQGLKFQVLSNPEFSPGVRPFRISSSRIAC